MRKILPLSSLAITFLVFSLLIMQNTFGQDCATVAANKSEPLTRTADEFMNMGNRKPASWDITKMKPHQAKVESWIRNLLTGFTGAKVGYSNEYSLDHINGGPAVEDFYKATGIKGYCSSTTRFWAYYCYEGDNKVRAEGEAGSFVYVTLNNVFSYNLIDGLVMGVGPATVNGKRVFEVLEKSHTEGRIDYYDQRKRMNYNDTINTSKADIIIIRNSDKPVFIPITRKEYLQQMLKDVEASRVKYKEMMTGNYYNNEKDFELRMKSYKLDKTYTPENEAKRRKWFEEDQAKLDKLIKKIDPDVDASLEVIKEYLSKSDDEWLGRTVRSIYPDISYTEKGVRHYFEYLDDFKESKEDYTRREIVSLNPDYFNKALSNDVPQLIMVEIVKNGYPYMYKLSQKIKGQDALTTLTGLINPGKSSPVQITPNAVTSTYTLRYLPKLTTLTPLAVPAGMKPSANPGVISNTSASPTAKFNFELPTHSPKLSQLPNLITEENYTSYIRQLNTDISNAVKPEEKRKADEYVKNKKLIQSKDISNAALTAWLQNTPRASLYLYSKALITNPSDALTANNFSAFLLMGGLPEKAIPILEYWNKKKPGEPTILSNLGNAYYRLGDVDNAMKYTQQCVQRDSLNATANKILCLLYLKKGDTKEAEEHGTKSLTTTHDEQVISILRHLDKQIKPGEIMSRFHTNEFPLLKRIRMPEMPANLDDMDQFIIDLDTEKKSVDITIESIEAKIPGDNKNVSQQMMMASFTGASSPLRVKAQQIIFDGMQICQREAISETDAFQYRFKMLAEPYNIKVNAISKKYGAQLKKLEGGEAGDEDKIAALELASCKEINAEKEKYVKELSSLVNEYAQRREFISRKFYRDLANWAPYWMPQERAWFLLIQRDYLKEISSILSEYKTVTKSHCEVFENETLAKKDPKPKEWEDEYCANFKGKIGLGPATVTWTCNSWGIEGGEGIVGEFEASFANDGSFEAFTIGGGLGAEWHYGEKSIAEVKVGTSMKEFIKLGVNKATGKPGVLDFGMKTDATFEAKIGQVSQEVKLIELSVAVNAGVEAGSAFAPLLQLK